MTTQQLQVLAGSFSSLIFMCGMLSMLLKTWRTRNVDSYSMTGLLLNMVGNMVYWFYILSLPFGPVYFLHGFYTVTTVLMLVWYFLYRHHPAITVNIAEGIEQITKTMDIPRLRITQTTEVPRM